MRLLRIYLLRMSLLRIHLLHRTLRRQRMMLVVRVDHCLARHHLWHNDIVESERPLEARVDLFVFQVVAFVDDAKTGVGIDGGGQKGRCRRADRRGTVAGGIRELLHRRRAAEWRRVQRSNTMGLRSGERGRVAEVSLAEAGEMEVD